MSFSMVVPYLKKLSLEDSIMPDQVKSITC